MNAWSEYRRVRGALILTIALSAAACGSTTGTSTAAAEDAPATTQSPTTTTEAPTTTSALTTTELASTTTAAPSDEPVDLIVGSTLTAGLTYRTTTQIPFQFRLPENDSFWQSPLQNQWAATVIFGNENMTSDFGAEPGFNLAVAEVGATPESVAEAMIESREDTIAWVRSEGLFKGRNAIILEGAYTDPQVTGPVPVMTGKRSHFSVLFNGERNYRSQIFEDQGRVFIISHDSHPDDVALVLAETAPVLESLEIGVDS